MQYIDEFLDVSCDFEHSFICGYSTSVTGRTFSWERIDASGLRYMHRSTGGTLFCCTFR